MFNAFAFNSVTLNVPTGFSALPDPGIPVLLNVDSFAVVDTEQAIITNG